MIKKKLIMLYDTKEIISLRRSQDCSQIPLTLDLVEILIDTAL